MPAREISSFTLLTRKQHDDRRCRSWIEKGKWGKRADEGGHGDMAKKKKKKTRDSRPFETNYADILPGVRRRRRTDGVPRGCILRLVNGDDDAGGWCMPGVGSTSSRIDPTAVYSYRSPRAYIPWTLCPLQCYTVFSAVTIYDEINEFIKNVKSRYLAEIFHVLSIQIEN